MNLEFREPANEWVFIERGPDGAWDEGGLLQAQGFENVGDQTYVYYGSWDPRVHQRTDATPARGGVGLVTLPRDRFADLVIEPLALGPGAYHIPAEEAQCELVTRSLDIPAGDTPRFYLNAEGLGREAVLKVELLGHDLAPLPSFSGRNAATVRQNGFQTPIVWDGSANRSLPARVRVRLLYEGKRRADIRFSALYLQHGTH